MRTNRQYDPVITTRKFTLSLREMSKRKSVENQMSGKRGKITSFLIPKEPREIGKFVKRRFKSSYITMCHPISCSVAQC